MSQAVRSPAQLKLAARFGGSPRPRPERTAGVERLVRPRLSSRTMSCSSKQLKDAERLALSPQRKNQRIIAAMRKVRASRAK
jgi:hypothetical protein